jgi:glycosyltransferase involved in cell wall biosynthesis
MLFEKKPLRLAILQRVCPSYRTELFSQLSSELNNNTKLFIGSDVPNSKVRNAANLTGINYAKLKTIHINLINRVLTWHVGLIKELKKFKPDLILCEGESHIVGYIQAILYQKLYNKQVALIHWCYISLPGHSIKKHCIRNIVKSFFRKFFDAFVLYSSFSKDCLLNIGIPKEKAFVATNVGNVKSFLNISDSMKETTKEVRSILKIPDRFTILYVGTLEKSKRPELILDLAKKLNNLSINYVLLGTGPMFKEIRDRIDCEHLENVFLRGHVEKDLPLYYHSADTLLIPGRGGIIISEAMAFEIPVIVHQADGIEYDLVKNKITGIHLNGSSLNHFSEAISFLYNNPTQSAQMGVMGRRYIKSIYTTENMVSQILCAAQYAIKNRRYKTQSSIQ